MANAGQNPNSNQNTSLNTVGCNTSKLLTLSAVYLTCNLTRNNCCCGYTAGNEYCSGSPDVISHGTCRGRDPKDPSFSAPIGTCIDIADRTCLLAKNSWTSGCEYTAATA